MYRAAKFASAISAGVVVSVPVATIPLMTVEAAEDCLIKPKDVTPPGQHWYYLIDRGSKRRCWYLHKETGTSAHASITRRARRAAIVDARKSDPAMTRTSADAHAEVGVRPAGTDNVQWGAQQTLVASDYPTGAGRDQPDAVSDASPQSPVTARWPEPAGVRSVSVEPPPPASFVVAAIAPDAKPEGTTTDLGLKDLGLKDLGLKDLGLKDLGPKDLGPKVVPLTQTSAEPPAAATQASLEPLFVATIGAITLTGFAGSSVYVMARIRRRPRSHPSMSASVSRGPGRPSAEVVDHSRLPRWLEPTATGSTRYPDRGYDAKT